MKFKIKILTDILKEKTKDNHLKYSQGRIYLFTAFISYFSLIGISALGDMNLVPKIDVEYFTLLSNSLQWIIALLAGYVFGGKTLEAAKMAFTKKDKKKEEN